MAIQGKRCTFLLRIEGKTRKRNRRGNSTCSSFFFTSSTFLMWPQVWDVREEQETALYIECQFVQHYEKVPIEKRETSSSTKLFVFRMKGSVIKMWLLVIVIGFILYCFLYKKYSAYIKWTDTGKGRSVYPSISLFASFFCETIERILFKFDRGDTKKTGTFEMRSGNHVQSAALRNRDLGT
jgi:hypothetical protein